MIALVVLLILLSATFSGLTIGMFSLSPTDLERKIKMGNKKAERIYKVRKNGNLLLCTLIFGNTIINATLTTVMNNVSEEYGISAGWIGPAISAAIIFFFGEVFPQALFSRHPFEVGAQTTWLVRIFMVIMWVVAKPMSMLLDYIFGTEIKQVFNKEELGAVLEEHIGESLNIEEQRRMVSAMAFSEKVAFDVLTPSTILSALENSTFMTQDVLAKIKEEHYSRIPILKKQKIMLLVFYTPKIYWVLNSEVKRLRNNYVEKIICY
jgi:metal transporter CNNM